MYRILQVGSSASAGGIESFLMNIYRNIDRNLVQFDFVNWNDKPLFYEQEIIDLGGKVLKIVSRRRDPLLHRKQMGAIINSDEYDIIINNVSSWSYLYSIKLGIKSGKKVIIHSHNSGISPENYMTRILNTFNKEKGRKHYAPLTARWACGLQAGQWLYGNNSFEIIPNGVDIELYAFNQTNRDYLRRQLNVKTDEILFGHVGRFSDVKNQKALVKIFDDIHRINTNTKLILIGDGPQKSEVEKLVESLKLTNYVTFTGNISNVNEYLSAMDCFIFPSKYEGFPVTLVEAQANGLPCFVSDTVSAEVCLSDLLRFIHLNSNYNVTASYILRIMREPTKDRLGYSQHIQNEGFSVRDIALRVQKELLELEAK